MVARGAMQDRCKSWLWIAGVGLLGGMIAAGGWRAVGQTPANADAPTQNPSGQSAVMQKRPPDPLARDSDPVASPDPQSAVPGQVPMPGPQQLPGSGQSGEI